MQKFLSIIIFTTLVSAFSFSILPLGQVFAQARPDYVVLSPLPGATNADNKTTSFPTYVTGIFNLGVGIAGVLAVMVIIFEGITHMLSESFTKKSDTTQRIQAALGGLLLALLAFLILKAINPALVNFNLNLRVVPDVGHLQRPPGSDVLLDQQLRRVQDFEAAARARDQAIGGQIKDIDAQLETGEITQAQADQMKNALAGQQAGADLARSVSVATNDIAQKEKAVIDLVTAGQVDIAAAQNARDAIQPLIDARVKKIEDLGNPPTADAAKAIADIQAEGAKALAAANAAIEYRKRCPSNFTVIPSTSYGASPQVTPCI